MYIVKCSDGSYYTGITNDIERRLSEHNLGLKTNSYTYLRRPVKLVYITEYQTFAQAERREKQIKGWSRKKKEALINENWQLLIELSKSKKQ